MDRFNDYINNEIRPHSHVEFEEDWVFNTFTVSCFKSLSTCAVFRWGCDWATFSLKEYKCHIKICWHVIFVPLKFWSRLENKEFRFSWKKKDICTPIGKKGKTWLDRTSRNTSVRQTWPRNLDKEWRFFRPTTLAIQYLVRTQDYVLSNCWLKMILIFVWKKISLLFPKCPEIFTSCETYVLNFFQPHQNTASTSPLF